MPHFLPACLPFLPACLPTAIALLLWQKCLKFCGESPFKITCMHYSLTVLALNLLYSSHCFPVQLPSKVMLRFLVSHHASGIT